MKVEVVDPDDVGIGKLICIFARSVLIWNLAEDRGIRAIQNSGDSGHVVAFSADSRRLPDGDPDPGRPAGPGAHIFDVKARPKRAACYSLTKHLHNQHEIYSNQLILARKKYTSVNKLTQISIARSIRDISISIHHNISLK